MDTLKNIIVNIEQKEYSIAPGNKLDIPLKLRNLGDNQDFFEISVQGIPANWAILSAQVVQIPPEQEREIILTIQPPPPPQTHAGIFPVKVVCTSQSDPRHMTEHEFSLRVAVLDIRGRIGVMMESVQFSVSPGNTINVPLLLQNQGLEKDDFRLSVEGLPVNWISTQTPTSHLEPGEKKEIRLVIKPPRIPGSKAGRHPFKIKISSSSILGDFIEVDCILTIAAYIEYQVGLQPVQVESGVPVRLTVNNKGNIDETFAVFWQNPANDLLFEAILPARRDEQTQQELKPERQALPLTEPYPIPVPSGQTGALDFSVKPASRAIIGKETLHKYSVTARPVEKSAAEGLTIHGLVTSKAWIPVWVVPVFVVFCIGFSCLLALYSGQTRRQTASATETSTFATAVAIGATQTSSANQTAAVSEGQLDSDGDGLRDQEENQLGSDPTNPDTDGDELTDGREVKEIGTNPLNADSDGDTISDGEEFLRRSTNPLNPDTDTDGLLDGDEVHRATDPINPDTDRDGLKDGDEVHIGTNPLQPDTDNDQLLDGQESPPCPNPLDPDSDKDGIIDGKDIDPCDPNNPSLTATANAANPPTPTPTQTIPAATPSATPAQASPTPVSLPGAIAYQSDRDGNLEIYVQNGANGVITRLTNNPAADIQPSWSPDGSRIAFTTNRDNNNEIYLMNADGSNLVNLTKNSGDDQYPTWSPNGLRIAFASNRDGNWEIYSVALDGSDLVNLSNNPADELYPAWFITGGILNRQELIAFTTNRDGNQEIYVMGIDGSDQTNLTNNPAADFYPAPSNSGNTIAFVSNRDGNPDVFLMGLNGASPKNLTNDPAEDLYPSWSFDDTWLAFATNHGNKEIYALRSDGSLLVNVTNNPAGDDYPAWR